LSINSKGVVKKIKGLTDRQREVYDFIKTFTKTNGYPPTIREISKHFGFSSPSGSIIHVKALQKKGYIERDHASRGIRLIAESPLSVNFVEVIGKFSKTGIISSVHEKVHIPIPSEELKGFAVESCVELSNFDILSGDYVVFESEKEKSGLSVCQVNDTRIVGILERKEFVTLKDEKYDDFKFLGSFYGVIRIPHKEG